MKKHLVYGAVFFGASLCVFAWWWNQPEKNIDRLTSLRVPSADTLFSKTENAEKIYLLKVDSSYVKKIIDSCEPYGGVLAAADQTSAASLINEADFKTLGLFTSNRIGCLIRNNTGADAWEFFVKDHFLYFQQNR